MTNQFVNLILAGDICSHLHQLATGVRKAFCKQSQLLCVDIYQYEFFPLQGKAPGDRGSDPLSGAGDQHHPATAFLSH